MESTQVSKKKMSLGKKILIGCGILISIGIIATAANDNKSGTGTSPSPAIQKITEESKTTNSGYPAIGQVLKTDYFEVTVTKAILTHKINTGNEYSDVVADAGNQFLVMTTTFKNIDNESRMLIDGSVFINFNGKDYEYDNSETIMADGYGLFLDQINPLTSKTTKLVYKLPAEINGPAYYKPGRTSDDEKIFLGDLK